MLTIFLPAPLTAHERRGLTYTESTNFRGLSVCPHIDNHTAAPQRHDLYELGLRTQHDDPVIAEQAQRAMDVEITRMTRGIREAKGH